MSIFTMFWPQWNRAYTSSSISGVGCNILPRLTILSCLCAFITKYSSTKLSMGMVRIINRCMVVCTYSEGCSAVVELANREELVPVLLFFLQPSLFFPDILTTAGPWYRTHEILHFLVGV